ncbi:MAG: carboxypeptidase-like regulatory domain-containing protein, partial [Paludibacter sp.]
MKLILLSLTFFLSLSISMFAQHSIQSTVFDSKNGLPIEIGNVRLLRTTDSTFVTGGQTDVRGNFQLNKVLPGNYTLVISFLGYLDYQKNIIMDNRDLILKDIQLNENAQMLGEVEVNGTQAQMTVKGDTLEYNATAFKTAENAVVEDLLKRLPGVEVGSDGKITVNGEEIKKIRVDGKKFFGDDVEMATKNIPAEMIDKIQVLEQKSDMALLTGFEDNDTERIINLTTKPNRKHGVFGNISGGAGMDLNKDVRYDGNAFINIMNNDAQTAITAGGNNTNTTRSSRGRNGMGNPSGGITTTQNLGLNNNTTVNPNLKIGGDASINHSANESITESNKESYLSGNTYTNHSNNISHNENYSTNLRMEVEWKPDTLNTIVLQPKIGYNRSFSDRNNKYSYLTGADTTSIGKSSNTGDGTSLNANINIIYSHKFSSKRGRTLTTNL